MGVAPYFFYIVCGERIGGEMVGDNIFLIIVVR